MKFYNGLWHYQGRTYATLRAALLAAWGGNSMKRKLTNALLVLAAAVIVLLALLALQKGLKSH